MKKRIYYHDTDCGGVVYYANYLKYIEEARTEYFEEKGIFVKELVNTGALFVVARQEVDYKLPSFYGDILDITTKLIANSNVKMEFEHEITNQNSQLICKAKTILVWVDLNIKPRQIPQEVKDKLNIK